MQTCVAVQKYFYLITGLSVSPLDILYKDQRSELVKIANTCIPPTLRFCFSGSGMKHSR